MDLIVASGNPGKIREYREILTPLGFRVFSRKEKGVTEEAEETGTTFEENAVLKARFIYERTGCPVLSDDSGLEVEALGGEPGVYSARYKGLPTERDRRRAILDALKDTEHRDARFVCCICFIDEAGEAHLFKGVWQGVIAREEQGENGFGYDPIFISRDGGGKTTASLPLSFKETYSHRARAVRMLTEYLNRK